MTLQASSQAQLRQFIEQVERLETEKKEVSDAIRDKFLEAKAVGFDPKIMKKVIALRKKPKAERTEEEMILDTYLHALGMAAAGDDTPLGEHWRDDADAEAHAHG